MKDTTGIPPTRTSPNLPTVPSQSQSTTSGSKANSLQETWAGSNVPVEYGLPQALIQSLYASVSFCLPCYKDPLVKLLVSDVSNFKGSGRIDQNDLRQLYGNGRTDEENFLSNFILDEYLLLLQKTSEVRGFKTEVVGWEKFERGSPSMLGRQLQTNGEIKEKDAIHVPCNSLGSEHWFLLVVQPKQKLIAVLDSLPGDFVKPTAQAAITKMCEVLHQADDTFDRHQWKFVTNNRKEIPLQKNGYDCGVFVSLYARCLVDKGSSMIKQTFLISGKT